MHPASPATTVLDSVLFLDAFGTPRMREVFSDHALIVLNLNDDLTTGGAVQRQRTCRRR